MKSAHKRAHKHAQYTHRKHTKHLAQKRAKQAGMHMHKYSARSARDRGMSLDVFAALRSIIGFAQLRKQIR